MRDRPQGRTGRFFLTADILKNPIDKPVFSFYNNAVIDNSVIGLFSGRFESTLSNFFKTLSESADILPGGACLWNKERKKCQIRIRA